MEIHQAKIEELISPEYNPRQITKEALDSLKESLNEFGYIEPIIVNDVNNHIVGGNQRYECLKQLGYETIDVSYVHIPDLDKEKALNIRLNNNSGDWDNNKLETILQEIELSPVDIGLTGFNDIELQDFNVLDENPAEIIEDDYTEEIENPLNIKEGDLYQLGNHRLLCADSAVADNITQLMDGKTADMLLTDPPYNVDYGNKNEFLNKYDGGNRIKKNILNDAIKHFDKFLTKIFTNITKHLSEYNTCYIFMADTEIHTLQKAMQDANLKFSSLLIWVKNNHVLGRKDYKAKHEICLYGWYNHHKFYGDFSTTILEFDKPLKNDLHPTMKPINLLSKLIKDGSYKNANIIDVFGGGGSTLIACEQLNRNCYMIEIDPHYVNVIIQRWENLTGQKAEYIKNIHED